MLATTLLVTTLLTVMLAASFLLVSAEQRTTVNSFGTARALALAQAGLESYYTLTRGFADSSTYDSTRVTLPNGYADVVATKLRPTGAGAATAMWVVHSSGVSTDPAMPGQVIGKRTIAQLAQLNLGLLPARAGLVALNGVYVAGATSTDAYPISGEDLNGSLCTGNPGGAAADTFGLAVTPARYSLQSGSTPATSRYGIATLDNGYASYTNLYDTTHIDWAGLLGGNFIPDYTIPPGGWPTPGSSTYLVAYVNGNVTLPAVPGGTPGMRGFLVVTGNVHVATNAHWDGILLAGGYFSDVGTTSYQLHGMVVTGLNRALGMTVPYDTVTRGAVHVQWTWCYTQSSVNALSSLVPIKNAWADTWTTY